MEKYSSPVPTWIRFVFIFIFIFIISFEQDFFHERHVYSQTIAKHYFTCSTVTIVWGLSLSSRSLYFSLLKQNRFPLIFFLFPGFLAWAKYFSIWIWQEKMRRSFSFFERFSKAFQDYPSLSRIIVVSTIRSSSTSRTFICSIYMFICSCFHVQTLRSLESLCTTYDRLIYQFLNLFQLWF